MSARLTAERAQAILAVIRAHPDGVTVAELAGAISNPPDARTLREWVLFISEPGGLKVEGQGPQTVCRAIVRAQTTAEPEPAPAPTPAPVQPEAQATSIETPAERPETVDVNARLKDAITYIVADCGLPTSQAPAILRRYARAAHLDGKATAAFVDRGMAVLTSLTEAEAATAYAIDARAFAVWREHCGWAEASSRDEPPQTAPGGSGPRQTAPNRDEPNQAAPGGDEPLQAAPAAPSRIEPLRSAPAAPNRDKPGQAAPSRIEPGRDGPGGDETGEAGGKRVESSPTGTSGSTSGRSASVEDSWRSWLPELTAWVMDRVLPRDTPREVRRVLPWLLATGLVGVLMKLSQHPNLMIALPIVVIGGVIVADQLKRRTPAAAANASSAVPGAFATGPERPRRWGTWTVGAVSGAVALGLAGYFWISHRPPRPTDAEVKAHLAATLAPLPVRIATIDVTYAPPNDIGSRITYEAVVETTEPLYRRTDPSGYLYSHAAPELARIDAAEMLLRSDAGARLRAAIDGPAPRRVREVVLLTAQTPVGTTAAVSGVLYAWHQDGAWRFTAEQGGDDRPRFAGEPKPSDATVFVADLPADVERLNALIAENVAYAEKVMAAAKQGEAARPPSGAQGPESRGGGAEPKAGRSEPVAESRGTGAADLPSRAGTPPSEAKGLESRAEGAASDTARADHGGPALPSQPSAPGTSRPTSVIAAGDAALNAQLLSLSSGAYVLWDGQWVPLPRNDGHRLDKPVPADMAKQFDELYRADGWTVEEPKHIVGEVIFTGRDPVPAVAATNVVIVYVGSLAARAAGYPVIELAPLRTQPPGLRFAPLSAEAPGLSGFGVRRVPADVKQPWAGVTELRCRTALAPGRYAVSCGGAFFEFSVE